MKRMTARPMPARVVAAIVAVAVSAVSAGVVLWSNAATPQASAASQQRRQALASQLVIAEKGGYTSGDLSPITSQLKTLDGDREPWWIPGRPGFYDGRAAQVARLETQLKTLERQLYRKVQTNASEQVDAARAEIEQDRKSNAASSDVQALQQRLNAAAEVQSSAHTLGAYRSAAQQAQSVLQDATTLYNQTQQENQAVQQAAQQLLAQTGGDLGAIQQAGRQAAASGRNDASIAAYLNEGGMIKSSQIIQTADDRLEFFAGVISSGDVSQAAEGTAGAQRYAGRIHDGLIAGMPGQAVIVSFDTQHLWAFENGQVVMDNAVTTGVRGVTAYGTDFGPMKVLWKSHPWTMRSPFPSGSQYWYPDTVVQWTAFFTSTGESIHDAYWEPDSALGPGSQFNPATRSHGCIHLPFDKAQWFFNWVQVGTPVIVYPGDGTSVANQVSLITTNSQGVPNSAG